LLKFPTLTPFLPSPKPTWGVPCRVGTGWFPHGGLPPPRCPGPVFPPFLGPPLCVFPVVCSPPGWWGFSQTKVSGCHFFHVPPPQPFFSVNPSPPTKQTPAEPIPRFFFFFLVFFLANILPGVWGERGSQTQKKPTPFVALFFFFFPPKGGLFHHTGVFFFFFPPPLPFPPTGLVGCEFPRFWASRRLTPCFYFICFKTPPCGLVCLFVTELGFVTTPNN